MFEFLLSNAVGCFVRDEAANELTYHGKNTQELSNAVGCFVRDEVANELTYHGKNIQELLGIKM